MSKIIVNDEQFDIENLNVDEEDGLKKVEFQINLVGESQLNLIQSFFKDEDLNVRIPEKDIEFIGSVSNSKKIYKEELNEETSLSLDYTIKETDPSEREYQSTTEQIAKLALEIELSKIRFNALVDELIKTDKISENEINNTLSNAEVPNKDTIFEKYVYKEKDK